MDRINRRIVISEPIDEVTARHVVSHLLAIADYDDYMSEMLKNYKVEPIEMYINSGGGSATAGFAIISAMELCEAPIITFGLGMVASMALGIFVAGDVRIASRLTRFMYHSVAYGNEGHLQDHEDGIVEAGILQEMYDELFLDRTKLSAPRMHKIRKTKKNFFFSGQRAVEIGIADEVLDKPEKKFQTVTKEQMEELEKELQESTEE